MIKSCNEKSKQLFNKSLHYIIVILKTEDTTEGIIKKIKHKKFSKNFIVFMFFLLLSTVFWFLNALNKTYTTDVLIPVSFYSFPESNIPTENTETTVHVIITAQGFEILAQKISTIFPLKVDVQKHGFNLQNKRQKAYILTDSLLRDVKNYFGENLKIEEVSPDTIIFDFSKNLNKKVPVQSNISYTTKSGYMISDDIKFIPDSITISGSKNILNKINFVFTQYKQYTNLGKNVQENLDLMHIKGVGFSNYNVEIMIKAEKFTESEITVPVEILNTPEKYNILAFPSEIKIKYKVPLSEYNLIKKEDFKAIADFLHEKDSLPEFLNVQLIKIPKKVKSVKIYPQKLEYIIEK